MKEKGTCNEYSATWTITKECSKENKTNNSNSCAVSKDNTVSRLIASIASHIEFTDDNDSSVTRHGSDIIVPNSEDELREEFDVIQNIPQFRKTDRIYFEDWGLS